MKALVTGAGGMLGRALMAVLNEGGHEAVGVTHSDGDVTRLGSLTFPIKTIQPDWIFHLAAFTRVDECETKADHAYLVNALVPRDSRIRITSQNRDYAQSTYEMAFVEAGAGSRFVSLDSLLRWGLLVCGMIVVSIQLISSYRRARRVAEVSAAITSR